MSSITTNATTSPRSHQGALNVDFTFESWFGNIYIQKMTGGTVSPNATRGGTMSAEEKDRGHVLSIENPPRIHLDEETPEEEIMIDEFGKYRTSEVTRPDGIVVRENRVAADEGKEKVDDESKNENLGGKENEIEDEDGKTEFEAEPNSFQEPTKTQFEKNFAATNRRLSVGAQFMKTSYIGERPLNGGIWDKSEDRRLFGGTEDKDGDGPQKVQHVPIPEGDLQKHSEEKAESKSSSGVDSKGAVESKDGGEGKERDSHAASEGKSSNDGYDRQYTSRDYK